MAGGLVPSFKRAGIAPVPAVPEPQRARGAGRGASANPASERTNLSPCDPQSLEDVIPLGSRNSSSAPLASTPPHPPLSLFRDSVPLPTREVVTAVTRLPALATAGVPRDPAPRPTS